MKDKLLNFSRNLIIALGLVVIVMTLFFATSSYAASGDTLGKLMRKTVSDWYRFILKICMIVYSIGYLIIILKLLADRTPERLKIVKESLFRFVIMFFVIYGLHYIMIMIMNLNSEGIELAKVVGERFSGINMETDEYDLYQTALSKAYELSSVPGFIGLIMYLLLVYYTYKFVIVYAKRFINVIGLILLAPIIFVVSTIKKIVTGVSDGKIGKWFKEFIFNIVIQTLHAIFYSILIGLTLKMSDNDENLIGALLTLILFGFIFKIDAIVRIVFNFVGGSTKINSSRVAGAVIDVTGGAINAGLGAIGNGVENLGNNIGEKGFKEGFGQSINDGKGYFQDKVGQMGNKISGMPNTIKTKSIAIATDFKSKTANAYAHAKAEAKDYDNILNGERVKANLTADEIIAQQHIIDDKKGIEGARQGLQKLGGLISIGGAKVSKLGKYSESQIKKSAKFIGKRAKKSIEAAVSEYKKDVENLENDIELINSIPKVIKSLKKKPKFIKTANGLNLDVTNTMMLVVDTDTTRFVCIAYSVCCS